MFFFFHIFWHPFSHSSVYEETISLMKHISLQESALIFFSFILFFSILFCVSRCSCSGGRHCIFTVAFGHRWRRMPREPWRCYLSKYKFVLLFFLYIYSWFIWRDLLRSLWLVKKEQCSQANKREYETEMEGNSEGSFRQVVHRRFFLEREILRMSLHFPDLYTLFPWRQNASYWSKHSHVHVYNLWQH